MTPFKSPAVSICTRFKNSEKCEQFVTITILEDLKINAILFDTLSSQISQFNISKRFDTCLSQYHVGNSSVDLCKFSY